MTALLKVLKKYEPRVNYHIVNVHVSLSNEGPAGRVCGFGWFVSLRCVLGPEPDQRPRDAAQCCDVGHFSWQGDRSAHGGGPGQLHVLEGKVHQTPGPLVWEFKYLVTEWLLNRSGPPPQ